MSYQGHNGHPPPPGDSVWTKTSTVAAVVGVVVAVVAAYFAYLAIPQLSPSPSPGPSSSSGAPTSAPSPSAAPDVSATPYAPAAPNPPPETATSPDVGQQGGGSVARPSTSLTVTPVAVNLGDDVTIVGSGFEPAQGLQVRLFRTDAISYPVGPDQVVAGGNGRFTIQGQVDNPGWCGSGTIAVFEGSGSAISRPPPLDEAVVTSRLGVIC